MRRPVGILLLVALTGFGVYLVFGASDERRALGVLRELASALNWQSGDTDATRRRRMESALTSLVTRDVVFDVPEFGQHKGIQEIAALLTQAEGIPLRVSIDQSRVQADGDRAHATLLLSVTWSRMGEERRETRTLTSQLARLASGFRVEVLRVSSRSRDPPEARP